MHNHSTRSDGLLSPTELIELAARTGVDAIALTDHDTTDGLEAAGRAARAAGIVLVPGVEISVSWGETTLHVVGLQVDPSHEVLARGLKSIRDGRLGRAENIAAELERLGFPGTLAGALDLAENKEMISRSHFARYLARQGRVKDTQAAFDKYLAKGKPAYVAHRWASLDNAVGWIRAAGGVAVLAHPGRYGLKPMFRDEMLAQFREPGRRSDRSGDGKPPSRGIRSMATQGAGAWVPRVARSRLSRAGRKPDRAGAASSAPRRAHAGVVAVGALRIQGRSPAQNNNAVLLRARQRARADDEWLNTFRFTRTTRRHDWCGTLSTSFAREA